jgi:hypothetical protein
MTGAWQAPSVMLWVSRKKEKGRREKEGEEAGVRTNKDSDEQGREKGGRKGR